MGLRARKFFVAGFADFGEVGRTWPRPAGKRATELQKVAESNIADAGREAGGKGRGVGWRLRGIATTKMMIW